MAVYVFFFNLNHFSLKNFFFFLPYNAPEKFKSSLASTLYKTQLNLMIWLEIAHVCYFPTKIMHQF